MNKIGDRMTLRVCDIEDLFYHFVDETSIRKLNKMEKIEIYCDEFGTFARLKEYPEDGSIGLFDLTTTVPF
jgi:hypothetical protein